MKKQQKWSGHKLTKEELKAVKSEANAELKADILILILTIFFGVIIIAFILEVLQ